ncbi:MAG TPA: SDR family oxidoreductase [Planctomycetes bacterium]|nr:SDR family oxidoreductase [Fuerstiella sp.]HIK95844.1 SDR family oxidoreductase [Planctomycetota bacterium]
MLRLDDKTAIITGGGSGIGKGIAEMFAQRGAHVQIFEVDAAAADTTAAEIVAAGGSATARVCDITDQNAVKSQVEAIIADRGKIDILVNNAGIAHVGSVTTTEEADFDRVMAVNVKGVYNCCYAVIPHMPQGSAILNIASTVAWFGLAERFAYSTSKGAVVALTYSVAKDFVDKGIRCNAILPGRIHTPFVDGFVAQNYPGKEAEVMQKLAEFQPIGRMGRPEEIAVAALFLCSDEASFVTGSVHPIDGGTLSLR